LDFSKTLLKLRRKASVSRYGIGQFTGLDQAYLLRLERGDRKNPSRDVVIMIALSLTRRSDAVEMWDIDKLLISAGYAPLRPRGG